MWGSHVEERLVGPKTLRTSERCEHWLLEQLDCLLEFVLELVLQSPHRLHGEAVEASRVVPHRTEVPPGCKIEKEEE
jgi:hypothetical protein